jgi:outer membrane receptor protein involved in Fe transport
MLRYILLFNLIINFNLSAQSSYSAADKTIKGYVVDSATESVLPFANITLHNNSDSSFITGVSSDSKGTFEINNVSDGSYYIKISFVGYDTKYVTGLSLKNNSTQIDLGKIALAKTAYEISGTEVVGQKVSEELHLDKKVINVAQNISVQGGTALDVLQNQPSVRVDPDGTVYLRGSSNFTILVNGKPYPLQGSDALKQISANTIENIELITNPSSKYDAEGSAGIVNINLKVQKDLSLSGIVNLNSGTGDKYNGDFSFSYNKDKWSLSSGFDYRDNTFTNEQDISRTSFIGNQNLYNNSDINIRNKRKQYSFRSGLDYAADIKNALGLSFSYGSIDMNGSLNTQVSNQQVGSSSYSMITNHMDIPVTYFSSTFTYQHKLNPEINDLNFELTYNFVKLLNEQLTIENKSNENFSNLFEMLNNTLFTNDSKRNEGRTKLSYNHKIDENSKFESGLQVNYSYRNFDLINKIYDESLQDYLIDNNLTNSFNLRNNVYAGFVSCSSKLEGFDFMVGLRGEYMDRFLDQKTLDESYKFNKMDYFPSASISRTIADHQIQLSYSKRINRPNENMLNPFAFYSDPNITISGNPKLKPEYIDALELNYQKMFGSVFVSAQTYYRKSKDSFEQIFLVDSTGKLNIIFDNYGNTDVYGAELSTSFSIAEIFKFDPSVNLFQTNLVGKVAGEKVEKDFFNWSARLNASVTISATTRFQLSGNYMKFIDAQSVSEPFMMISASLRQEFLDKAVSLTLQARNLFNASDMKFNTTGSNFIGSAFIQPEAPVFTLLFSYNFNNFKRVQKPNDNVDIPTGL